MAEERRGRPGPARDAALSAARDPALAVAGRLDAACACLVGGEPRRALALLDDLEPDGDEGVSRRIRACRVWASQLDRNWYPGDVGGELADDLPDTLPDPGALGPADPETALLEGVVSVGPVPLLTTRALIDGLGRQGSPATGQVLGSASQSLERFAATAGATGAVTAALWARAAQADLAYRAGLADVAQEVLGAVRQAHESLGDAVGVATTHLIEGDWLATSGSSPEALGHDLALQTVPSPLADRHDAAGAGRAYARAEATLEGRDEPRAAGALAIRLAALAARAGQRDTARSRLDAAHVAFAEAGDAAGERLVVVHRILLDLADGEIAATRRSAGSGWDLAPRGPIAAILDWATRDGSVSFCTGLGRLVQRAGEAWEREGDLERASVAFSVAAPLIGASGAVAPANVLAALARVDATRGFAARALARLEQAIERFPPVPSVDDHPERWMEQVDVLMSVANVQTGRVTSSPAAQGIRGLERLLERMRALAGLPDVPGGPPPRNLLREGEAFLDELARARGEKDVDALLAESGGSAAAAPFLAATLQILGDQINVNTAMLAFSRARLAQRTGWPVEAEGWFDAAQEAVDRAGPAADWMSVLILAQRGREADARDRFARIRQAKLLPDAMLASLALRARVFDVAAELTAGGGNGDGEALSWPDLLDRAETALERGHPEEARRLGSAAIELFEAGVGRLARDPDRLAAADDVKVPSLYLIACRASLAIAEAGGGGPGDAGWDASAGRCLELADRARSLAILGLIGGLSAPEPDAILRRWQEAATEWSAAFERLLASYEGGDERRRGDLSVALSRADDRLTDIEAQVEDRRPRALTPAGLPEPVRLAEVQRSLPRGACLVHYQLVGRELMVLGVTSSRFAPHRRRLDGLVVEPLVNALWRSCAAGAAGPEAEELARLLLDPVGDLLATHDRVIVVPFGPLNAVPFHALPFEGAPLGAGHVLSYLPAAALLGLSPVDRPLQRRSAAVVGDPEFDPAARPDLRRLAGARVEAQAVADLYGTTDLLVAGAARERAVRPLLPGRAVIHLAAHGHLDEIAPSTSSIVLAGRDELTVAELIGMRLDAELAVLSACDSGRGAATLGGDLVGLARGLIAAGVRRAVVSLWPVDDDAACVTMAAFHERLVGGDAPAPALAAAQASVRGLSAADLAARFAALGGGPAGGTRSVRRGGGPHPAGRGAHVIAMDPQFVDDAGDSAADAPADLHGGLARVWAPFILVGS